MKKLTKILFVVIFILSLGACSKHELIFFYDSDFKELAEINPCALGDDSSVPVFDRISKIAEEKKLKLVPFELKNPESYSTDIFSVIGEREKKNKNFYVIMTAYVFTHVSELVGTEMKRKIGVVGPLSDCETEFDLCGNWSEVIGKFAQSLCDGKKEIYFLGTDSYMYNEISDVFIREIEKKKDSGIFIRKFNIGIYDGNIKQTIISGMENRGEIYIVLPFSVSVKKFISMKDKHIFIYNYPIMPVKAEERVEKYLYYNFISSFDSTAAKLLEPKREENEKKQNFCYGLSLGIY